MDGLVKKKPQLFSLVREDEVSKTYQFPKKLVCIRSKEKTMTMTDEQRRQATKRLGR